MSQHNLRMLNNVPEIYIEDPSCLLEGLFQEELIAEYDIFYRRVLSHTLAEGTDKLTPLVLAIYEETEEYLFSDDDEPNVLLDRARLYFEWIEEYETCALVRDLINQNQSLTEM